MSGIEIGARPKSRTGRAAEWAVDVLMGLLGGRPETSHGKARHLPLEKLATVGDRMLDDIALPRADLDALIQVTAATPARDATATTVAAPIVRAARDRGRQQIVRIDA